MMKRRNPIIAQKWEHSVMKEVVIAFANVPDLMENQKFASMIPGL